MGFRGFRAFKDSSFGVLVLGAGFGGGWISGV